MALHKIFGSRIPCLVVGDINIDLLHVTKDKSIEKYLSSLISNSCLPAILLRTRITFTSSMVIDHIYHYHCRNSINDLNLVTGKLFSDLSDYLPVFSLLLNSNKRNNFSERPLVKLFTESNKLKYEDCLSKIDWSNLIYNNNDCRFELSQSIAVLLVRCSSSFGFWLGSCLHCCGRLLALAFRLMHM